MRSPARDPAFVLVHSALVGPTSWLPVAHELERRGRVAAVPLLLGVCAATEPRWRHVPEAVRVGTRHLRQRVVLVGHSGAGPLLPVIADALGVEVAALVFVDSLLPPPARPRAAGSSRVHGPAARDGDRGVLAPWFRWFGADAMRELVPDQRLRADLEAEMPRLPLSYFEAAVPLPDDWASRRPCAYLLLSAPCEQSAAEARARGWRLVEIHGVQHLAIAANPGLISEGLLDLERLVGNRPGGSVTPADSRRGMKLLLEGAGVVRGRA